jgi:hypothetical protein
VSLLFPSVSRLIVLVLTLLVAALCVGLGQFVGARRPAIALVAGWGLACVAFVVADALLGTPLSIVAAILALVGAAGLAVIAQGSFEDGSWRATFRVLVLALPFLLIAAATGPSGPDEFSAWLPNIDYLYRHDHFPSLKVPSLGSERPGTPYAMAYVSYAVSLLLGRVAETAGIVWNALLLLAVGALCGDMVESQIKRRENEKQLERELDATEEWGVSAIGLLAATMFNPSFVPRFFLSNTDDGAVGSVTAVAIAAIMLWLSAETRKTRDERLMLVAAVGFCCAAMVQLRQDGLTLFALVFIAAVAATPLERYVGRRINPSMLLLMLPPTLLAALVWREYQVIEIPDEALAVLNPADWHWAALPLTLWSMLYVAISKIGYTALVAVLLGFALAIADAPELFTPFQRTGVVMGSVLAVAKVATLVVLYLVADYTAQEAAAAKDFWRYLVQIGPALMVAAIPLVPPRLWSTPPAGRLLCMAAPVLMLGLPIVSVRYMRVDQPRASYTPYLRDVARDVAELIGPAPIITLVDPDDPSGDLASLAIVRYTLQTVANRRPRLQPGPPVPSVVFIAGSPPVHVLADGVMPRDAARGYPLGFRETDMARQLAVAFVWFRDGGDVASQMSGLALAPGASYLVAHRDGKTDLVKSWPFQTGG